MQYRIIAKTTVGNLKGEVTKTILDNSVMSKMRRRYHTQTNKEITKQEELNAGAVKGE